MSYALDKLEEKSKEDQQAACTETADLRTTPGKQDTKTGCLETSKEILQPQSEEVSDVLASRILPSNFFNAMGEQFQLVIEDNDILKKKIKDQTLEISSAKNKIKRLDIEMQCLKKQRFLDQDIIAELEGRIISQDIALGRLQFEVDCIVEEYHHEIEGKNDLMVNLQAQNDNPSSEIGSLAQATNDKG